jgi:hypothetical protein
MRGELLKEVRARFNDELSSRFPRFELARRDGGLWTWSWKIGKGLTFFVSLQAIEKSDKFVVELAWSEDGEFPWSAIRKFSVTKPSGRIRLGRLWEKSGPEPVWDLAPETSAEWDEHIQALARGERPTYPSDLPIDQVRPRINPMVHDAIGKLEQYGFPIYRSIAERYGLEWP